MNINIKISEMRNLINSTLKPLIGNQYALLEIPHYYNIGDILIWEGELAFLTQLKSKLIYSSSSYNYNPQKKLPPETTILLQGGGNWGDIWEEPQQFRKKIISSYPHNNIIIFPQTIYYKDKKNLIEDSIFFSHFPNVTICARDQYSFNILKTYFKNNKSFLLPDMAFFINIKKNFLLHKGSKILFAKRLDKEYSSSINYDLIPNESEIHDWPTYEKNTISNDTLSKISLFLRLADKCLNTSMQKEFVDLYWEKIRKKELINLGLNFLKDYHTIYTTRLHIAILGALMGKKIYILDNNYGKLSNFYYTWLKNTDNINLIKQ